jgi:hypothetical protein
MKKYTITEQDIRYEIGEYQILREEHLDSKGRNRMFWVLRKDNVFVHAAKSWEDMVLEMMIWTADSMEE